MSYKFININHFWENSLDRKKIKDFMKMSTDWN